jgi:hypothetical protein
VVISNESFAETIAFSEDDCTTTDWNPPAGTYPPLALEHRIVDARMFGPGERIVFEAYPKEIFERTRRWIESWNLFPPEQAGRAGYDASVV